MYAEAKKSIYGTLEASLLFWAKLSKSLEEMGYQRMNMTGVYVLCPALWSFLQSSHITHQCQKER